MLFDSLKTTTHGYKMKTYVESIGTLQSNNKNGKYSKNVLLDATELANFAKKALKEKDGDLTIERLQDAVNILMM
jgi:hypothetical protein